MESFFRRMSLIVSKNSTKSTGVKENEQENSEEDYGRLRTFREMQERRKSAPDIHKRVPPTSKVPMQSENNSWLSDPMNVKKLTTEINLNLFSRPHSNSTGKFE